MIPPEVPPKVSFGVAPEVEPIVNVEIPAVLSIVAFPFT
jgi:hypothetical protein